MVSGRVIRGASSPTPPSAPSPPATTPAALHVNTKGTFTKSEYSQALGLSWLFYEAQRSGRFPTTNYRISWRRSSHLKDVVTGGWYDAGDYLKLNFPLASTVTLLAWGLLEFNQGYNQSGQTQYAMDNLYAAVDYLKRCHIAPRKYVGQIGHPGMFVCMHERQYIAVIFISSLVSPHTQQKYRHRS